MGSAVIAGNWESLGGCVSPLLSWAAQGLFQPQVGVLSMAGGDPSPLTTAPPGKQGLLAHQCQREWRCSTVCRDSTCDWYL